MLYQNPVTHKSSAFNFCLIADDQAILGSHRLKVPPLLIPWFHFALGFHG